jgi:hypothetical protein
MSARAPFSLVPTPRVGGAELSAVERQLIEDFRQMGDAGRALMPRFFAKQASRDREQRIAASKLKFQLMKGGA